MKFGKVLAYHNVDEARKLIGKEVPSAQPEQLTDKEQRIFLASGNGKRRKGL